MDHPPLFEPLFGQDTTAQEFQVGSWAGHRQTSQMAHPRGYEAQKTEPNPTSTASPKTVSVKPENPAGREEGWSPESTGPEKGALDSLPPLQLHQTSHSA